MAQTVNVPFLDGGKVFEPSAATVDVKVHDATVTDGVSFGDSVEAVVRRHDREFTETLKVTEATTQDQDTKPPMQFGTAEVAKARATALDVVAHDASVADAAEEPEVHELSGSAKGQATVTGDLTVSATFAIRGQDTESEPAPTPE